MALQLLDSHIYTAYPMTVALNCELYRISVHVADRGYALERLRNRDLSDVAKSAKMFPDQVLRGLLLDITQTLLQSEE
jgi:hypothetical protein